ncbi:MAG: translation initiation factor IF-3 [Oligoflexia bacterium]|nr:translation initiation factor IF-3 [Oligoflexia bacterium]
MLNPKKTVRKADKGPRINREIHASEIRLIDQDGAMLGIMSVSDALSIALEKGLDLVEVNPNGEPPVVKIIDYGRYKYELKKKQQEAKKRQVNIVIKEIQFRPNIDKHDFDFKVKHIQRFISEGNKVKVVIVFRGRELAHPEMADDLIERIRGMTDEYSDVEFEPKREGKRIFMMLIPKAA